MWGYKSIIVLDSILCLCILGVLLFGFAMMNTQFSLSLDEIRFRSVSTATTHIDWSTIGICRTCSVVGLY